MFRVLFIMCSFLLVFISDSIAYDELNKVQDFYKSYKDLEGVFTQKYFVKELNKSITYKGYFYVKGNNILLDYKGKRPQKVYINQSEIIIYQPTEKTAFKTAFDESRYDQTPLAIIRGLADIKRDFQTKKLNNNLFSLKPIKPMGNIVEIKLTLSDTVTFPISKITLLDNKEGSIEITFLDVKFNQGTKDSLFRFEPPSDVTVVNQ